MGFRVFGVVGTRFPLYRNEKSPITPKIISHYTEINKFLLQWTQGGFSIFTKDRRPSKKSREKGIFPDWTRCGLTRFGYLFPTFSQLSVFFSLSFLLFRHFTLFFHLFVKLRYNWKEIRFQISLFFCLFYVFRVKVFFLPPRVSGTFEKCVPGRCMHEKVENPPGRRTSHKTDTSLSRALYHSPTKRIALCRTSIRRAPF